MSDHQALHRQTKKKAGELVQAVTELWATFQHYQHPTPELILEQRARLSKRVRGLIETVGSNCDRLAATNLPPDAPGLTLHPTDDPTDA